MVVRARTAAIVLAAIVAAPALVSSGYDSFPFSTYPMFARDRARVASVSTVVVRDEDGNTERLSSGLIGGTQEPMLAMEAVSKAIDRDEADAFCHEVAGRAARSGIHGILEVVDEAYDTLDWFSGDHAPIRRVVRATCRVPE